MYTDFLTKIHNAQKAKKTTLKTMFTGMDFRVAEILAQKGFIVSAVKKGRAPKRVIEVELKYVGDEGAIGGIRFVSVPSRRIYAGYKELHRVRQGFGTAIISTHQGIMTAAEARKQKVGGQILFEIW